MGDARKAPSSAHSVRPATSDAFTAPYPGRTIANGVHFLEQVDGWLPAEVERIYAVLDNLSTHRAVDVLLFQLPHPRWEFVFQPTSAAYLPLLNLIDPWWKILRSLALKMTICGTLRPIKRHPQWLWQWIADQETKAAGEFFQPMRSRPRSVSMMVLGPISILIER